MVLKENGIMDVFYRSFEFWVLIILTSELWRSFTLCISFILFLWKSVSYVSTVKVIYFVFTLTMNPFYHLILLQDGIYLTLYWSDSELRFAEGLPWKAFRVQAGFWVDAVR